MSGAIPVTQRGHSPNHRCVRRGCLVRVAVGQGMVKLIERVGDEVKVTQPLCPRCAPALQAASADPDAQVVVVEEYP